jgi:Mn-containing catalase
MAESFIVCLAWPRASSFERPECEIAPYTTARNLSLQLRQPAIVQLLTLLLGEEQNAGQLLDQVAQPLMSVAKMPASVE